MSLAPNYPIETERLSLRPFESRDREGLRAIRTDPEVLRYLPFPLAGEDDLTKILTTRAEMTRLDHPEGGIILAIEERGSGQFAGDVGLMRYEPDRHMAEVGFSLVPAFQGKGYVQEASRALMAWGFGVVGLHRIIGKCDARNDASSNALRRLGLRQEGHMREDMKVRGEWVDTLLFAILEDEWRG